MLRIRVAYVNGQPWTDTKPTDDDGTAGDRRRVGAGDAVRRMLVRAAAGFLAAALTWAGARAVEIVRIGRSDADAMDRIASEVRGEIETIAADLRDVTRRAAVRPAVLTNAPSSPEAMRTLFDDARRSLEHAPAGRSGVTIYGSSGAPVAWSGRPSDIPLDRLRGPAALFMAPGPIGPRLIHVEPLVDGGTPAVRAGTIAAERVLGGVDGSVPGTTGALRLETSFVPVTLRGRYEGAGASTQPYRFLVPDGDGRPLLEAQVDPADLVALRARYREGSVSLALAVLAPAMLVVAVPVEQWRRGRRTPGELAIASGVLVALMLTARILLSAATPAGWMWSHGSGGESAPMLALFFRSPVDLLATAALLVGLVALAADLVERRRLRVRHHQAPAATVPSIAAFGGTHLAAGVALAAVLLAHHALMARVLEHASVNPVQFSLHPLEPARIAFVLAVLAIHTAAFWATVLVLRLAASAWRVARGAWGLRAAMVLLWLLPVAVAAVVRPFGQPLAGPGPMLLAAAIALVMTGLLRWVGPRYRHGSHALRLVTAFLALAVPSLVFYPTLVALAGRATERLMSEVLGPQALAHRAQLRLRLDESLKEIDQLPDLAALVASQVRTPGEPPSSDAAYSIWNQTELARLRLTSSVELYGADGTLVSRFALNLPVDTEQWVETGCTWDRFGEPFAGSEDRVLLHAGRGICPDDEPPGTARPQGAIVVHVMLDYATLPFLASSNVYGDLFQPASEVRPDAHGSTIEFAMYGWGRTPVFPTEGSAWPISSELLSRIYRASYRPLWELVRRGDRTYKVLFLDDRAGIYALGYPLPRPVDHLVALAEIATLAGVAYVALLVVSWGLALLGGYRSVTGRALLREIRGSFYRKLFLAFVAAAVVPVLALAFLTRTYVAGELRDGIETQASRTVSVARRVVESVVSQQRRGSTGAPEFTDEMMVGISRVINEDVNVFTGPRLAATSQRDLFASGRLPVRTPAEAYQAILLERQASYVGDEQVGPFEYLVAAAPVREGELRTIVTVPLALRQQETEREIDALDRRVLLATVCFILLGAAIGYSMAERIADPVNRLTRATRRIAHGDLDARIAVASADEFRRLVDAFNGMAADLQRQRDELERTNRLEAWAEMARQVAHDIKNPLTPIQLSAEHLRRVHHDRGEPLSPVLEACVTTILSQVRLLRQISSEFSSFATSPVAKLAPAQLNDIVAEVLEPYRAAPPGGVGIETALAPGLPIMPLDRILLARALVNVVENALHAMPAGGRLTLRTSRADGTITLDVTDTGVGMDDEARGRLFEPYFSTRGSGTGLGLTIAKRNVELNNGTIEVESTPGVGTTVHLQFPVSEQDAAPPDRWG
jgi:signal transduction histidine kinase